MWIRALRSRLPVKQLQGKYTNAVVFTDLVEQEALEQIKVQFATLRSNEAKRLGRHVQLRPNWENVKLPIMEDIVRAKFTQNEDLKELLLATGDLVLEEGNTWHDTFWGVDAKTREGTNHLGRILMRVRQELREESYDFLLHPKE